LPLRLARKLWTLSFAEWLELVQAQWSLLRAEVALRRRPVGLLAMPSSSDPTTIDYARVDEARHIALSVVRAARFGVFRPKCLARSLAVCNMLADRGIAGAVLRIGVRRNEGDFLAHAWVEFGGETIGDADDHVGTFVPLTNVTPLAASGSPVAPEAANAK
jgi:hypothetical protein